MISALNDPLPQELEYTLQNTDCHSWWISKMQSGREEEQYAIKFYSKLEKMQCDESWIYCCYILTFAPAQKCYSKVIHRKEVTHSNGQ